MPDRAPQMEVAVVVVIVVLPVMPPQHYFLNVHAPFSVSGVMGCLLVAGCAGRRGSAPHQSNWHRSRSNNTSVYNFIHTRCRKAERRRVFHR